MKKLLNNSNPFLLLLIPVLVAMVLGVSYQFEQAENYANHQSVAQVEQTTSLFTKGVKLVKAVCAISDQKFW